MSLRTSIKMLSLKENMTLTKLAKEVSVKANKIITVDSLSKKLQKQTMKYNEAEFLIEAMGYKINFEKMT